MVLRGKPVGEQDVADQRRAFSFFAEEARPVGGAPPLCVARQGGARPGGPLTARARDGMACHEGILHIRYIVSGNSYADRPVRDVPVGEYPPTARPFRKASPAGGIHHSPADDTTRGASAMRPARSLAGSR